MQQKRGGQPQHRSHFVRIWDYVEDGTILSLGRAKAQMWVRAKAVVGDEEDRRSKVGTGEEVPQSPWENKTEPDRQREQEPEMDLRGAETQGSKRQQGGVLHQPKGIVCHHTILQAKVRAEQKPVKWDWHGYLQSLVHHSCTRMGRMVFWKDGC